MTLRLDAGTWAFIITIAAIVVDAGIRIGALIVVPRNRRPQTALAWLLAQGPDVVPIPGTKRRSYLEQNCAALAVKLTPEEITTLSKAFPLNVTAGTRYPEKQMGALGV